MRYINLLCNIRNIYFTITTFRNDLTTTKLINYKLMSLVSLPIHNISIPFSNKKNSIPSSIFITWINIAQSHLLIQVHDQ